MAIPYKPQIPPPSKVRVSHLELSTGGEEEASGSRASFACGGDIASSPMRASFLTAAEVGVSLAEPKSPIMSSNAPGSQVFRRCNHVGYSVHGENVERIRTHARAETDIVVRHIIRRRLEWNNIVDAKILKSFVGVPKNFGFSSVSYRFTISAAGQSSMVCQTGLLALRVRD